MSYDVRERVTSSGSSSVLFAVIAVLLVLAPFALPVFQIGLLAQILIFAIFATAFNLLYGYTGLLSFGHAMFVAASGYTVAIFIRTWSGQLGFPETFGGASVLVTFVVAILLGVLVATLLGVFIGYLSVQLQEIYFAMITLSFSMAIYSLLLLDPGGLTNGSDGLSIFLSDVNLFGMEFALYNIRDPTVYYFIVLGIFAASMYTLWRIVNSPFGMVCKAIRENPQRTEAIGIDGRFHSWMTFILSGAFSGLAGALLIPLRTGITPELAYWSFSAEPVIMTVIGGPYAFAGPAVGAFVYLYLRYIIDSIPVLAEHWEFFFGFVLLLVVLFFQNGVAGGLLRLRDGVRTGYSHYQRDGWSGVSNYTQTTVRGWGQSSAAFLKGRVTATRLWFSRTLSRQSG